MLDIPFLIASSLMGLGIAIDVAIATVSRFRDESMGFRNWTLPVSISHIVLPAFGYYGWWILGEAFSGFILVLGLLAFLMIAVFIYETFCDWIGVDAIVSLEPATQMFSKCLGMNASSKFTMVLAVSMDALWSGPAKAAQAASGNWTAGEVVISFFIAGTVVAIVSELSLLIAVRLRKISFDDIRSLARYLVFSKYLESSILFAFGLLSLRNSFSVWIGLGQLTPCILTSGVFMFFIWLIYWRKLFSQQLLDLKS